VENYIGCLRLPPSHSRRFNRPAGRDRTQSGIFIVASLVRTQIEPDRGSQERDSAAAGAAVGGA